MTATTTRVVPVDLLPHLRRARDHIDRKYEMPLELDDLAAVAGVSKFHFARCFAATYGETPIRYLTRRRIERAQDLLRSANLTVTEVCMAVGFTSLGSFSLVATAIRSAQRVTAALPKATLNRSHQMTTDVSPAMSASAGIA